MHRMSSAKTHAMLHALHVAECDYMHTRLYASMHALAGRMRAHTHKHTHTHTPHTHHATHLVQGVAKGVRRIGGYYKSGIAIICKFDSKGGCAAGLAHATLAAQQEELAISACHISYDNSMARAQYVMLQASAFGTEWPLHPALATQACNRPSAFMLQSNA
eukprot:1160217-Pelagomonas_calceolata.AAC.12